MKLTHIADWSGCRNPREHLQADVDSLVLSAWNGRAGLHTVIADRPPGKASGMGLGFNGGELLALSLGGCFCNDVHYTADQMGLTIAKLMVWVTIELGGEPLLVSSADVITECELSDGLARPSS